MRKLVQDKYEPEIRTCMAIFVEVTSSAAAAANGKGVSMKLQRFLL